MSEPTYTRGQVETLIQAAARAAMQGQIDPAEASRRLLVQFDSGSDLTAETLAEQLLSEGTDAGKELVDDFITRMREKASAPNVLRPGGRAA